MFILPKSVSLSIGENNEMDSFGYMVKGIGHDPVIMPSNNRLNPFGLNKEIDRYCQIIAHDSVEHFASLEIESTGETLWFDPYTSELVAHGVIVNNRPQVINNICDSIYGIIVDLVISGESPTNVDLSLFDDVSRKAFLEMKDACIGDISCDNMIDFLNGELDLSDYIDYDDERELQEILESYYQTALEFFALGYLVSSEHPELQYRFYGVKTAINDAYSAIAATLEGEEDYYGSELHLDFSDSDNITLSLEFRDTIAILEAWNSRYDEDLDYDDEGYDNMTAQDKAVVLLDLSQTSWEIEL